MIPIQFKDEVARKYGYKDWREVTELQDDVRYVIMCSMLEEAALLYAQSKWDEACEACAELACVDNIGTDGEAYILNHRPEFKP